MIKTIKVKKQMRLDELIKYVWDSNDEIYKGESVIAFKSKDGNIAEFEGSGIFQSDHWFDFEDTFTVEVEEEITEDTTFERLVTLGCRGTINVHDDKSLSDLSGRKEYGAQAFALINGKLELIWEAE